MGSATPQSAVDAMVKTPEFIERFSRFANTLMNDEPGANSAEDASFHVIRYILQNNRPWKDAFIGGLNVTNQNNQVTVVEDANGLGYFRSKAWMDRYAGNELDNLKIVTAYRMLNNALGLKLTATTNAPGADVSAAGRASPACRGCHLDGWYALDKVADVLTRVRRENGNVTYVPPPNPDTARSILGGKMVKNDQELMNTLVDSEHFQFNACRTAFKFLYGRAENVCESQAFDKCVEAFKADGMIQTAIATVAKDASFCQ
jgi:hypothetical protein